MNCIRRILSLALAILLLSSCFAVTAVAADNLTYGIGFVITSKLRLYSKASFQSDVIDIASEGECVILVSQKDDWFKVRYNMQDGYMRADCLRASTQEEAELGYGKITNAQVVYLRSGPGTGYSILSSGFRGNEFYTLGIDNGWYKILKDDATCYVRSDFFELKEIPYENEDSENEPQFFTLGEQIGELTYEESEPVSMGGVTGYYAPIDPSKILATAQKYIGVPYVFGGTSPSGFDCSGLVYYVLAELGYPAPRTAAAQYAMGSAVSPEGLCPGDLVFFENTYTSGISHVGIYAGGGKFLHAPTEGSSVSYSSISGYWAEHYAGARRLG